MVEEPMASEELFHFRVPGRLEYRDAARTFITHVCERLVLRNNLPPELPYRVISAFNEAFNNAVIHAYRDRQAGPIEVELTVTTDTLRLRISDEGHGFRPELVPPPTLDGGVDSLPEGGMGLFIMRSFMDRVEFARDQHKNVLTMEKDLVA
jgi:serine/threonine-protein kinase RsbW